MTNSVKIKKALSSAWGPSLAVLFVMTMIGYAVFGPTGLYAWGEYSQSLVVKQKELAALEARQAVLQNRVALLDPEHVDPDMADELVRKDLNVTAPDEVIIPLK